MRFRILGPLEVFDGTGWTGFGAAKSRLLLTALLMRAHTALPVDQLVFELWRDTPPKTAATQIHGYVMRLRRVLGDADGRLLVTGSQGYRLRLGDRDVDRDVFHAHAEQGRAALRAGQAERAAELLGQALALWRGPALADVPPTPLVEAEVTRLTELRLTAWEARIEADLECGRHASVIGELRSLLDEHPLREEPWRQLMVALYRDGRQAEALRTFQRLRRTLIDEVGVEPGAAVQRLHRQLLAGELAPAAAGPAVPPIAASRPTVPRQLPTAPAFIGRANEIGVLDTLLGDRGVVAITGVAGVGKTALALHWAHLVADRFPDGQLYVNLRGYDDGPPVSPAAALAQFLHALGVAPDEVPPDEDGRAALYRTLVAGRRMLVVLDNAASPDQVRPLLPGCPVVITSRDDLRGLIATHGARGIGLDVLPHDDALVLLADILGPDRTGGEPGCAAELAALCGHLPLALRIAAANLAARTRQSIAGYVSQLRGGNRLAELTVAGDRHAAVRAAFDISHAGLPEPARRMFNRLGLIPGMDFDAHAAAALSDTTLPDAAAVLDQLAAAHMIEPSGVDRYTFHDLVRLYAKERANNEPAEHRAAALTRLFGYYLGAGRAAAALVSPQMARIPNQDTESGRCTVDIVSYEQAMDWLETERANLIAAIGHAAGTVFRAVAWQLACGLRSYLFTHRLGDDWLAAADAGLVAATEDGDHTGQAAMHLSLGQSHGCLGDLGRSAEHFRRAVDGSRLAGWPDGESMALNGLGVALMFQGELSQACQLLTESLAIATDSGPPIGQARALVNLGWAYQITGRLADALDCDRRALAIYELFSYERGRAIVVDNLGTLCRWLGELDLAQAMHEEVRRIGREVGSKHAEAAALCHLAEDHRDAGRDELALAHAEAAVRVARVGADYDMMIEAMNVLGSTQTRVGRLDEADDCYAEVLRATGVSGFMLGRFEALIGLAGLRARQGRAEEALRLANDGLELARRHTYPVAEAQALLTLADLSIQLGQSGARYAEQAQAVYRAIGLTPRR